MLRDRIQRGVAKPRLIEKMQSGALVSDEVVNQMVEERLAKPDAAEGFVLDGYPRTLQQAEHLGGWLDQRGTRELVIHLEVDYNIIVKRLTGRRECPRCGTLYNLAYRPPKVDEICDLDGEKLIVRNDDRESVIRERLEAYESQTRPVLEFYKGSGKCVLAVEASNDPPDQVFQKISQAIKLDDCSKNGR
jgi:adenylate kinase